MSPVLPVLTSLSKEQDTRVLTSLDAEIGPLAVVSTPRAEKSLRSECDWCSFHVRRGSPGEVDCLTVFEVGVGEASGLGFDGAIGPNSCLTRPN
jgi:hypothetical protein